MISSRGTTSLGYDAAGRISTVQAPDGGNVTFGYDGSLKTSESWSGAVGGTVGWTYDNDFRVASTSVNGTAVSYAYDFDSLLTGAGPLSIGREPATGRVSSISLGTVGTSFAYDNFGDLDWHEATANGTSLYSYTLYRDNAGRISGKAETIQGVTTTWSYDYDAAGRLSDVSASGQPVASYAYDANGNRLQKTTPSGVEDGAADDQDRLVAFGAATYAYTATGALAAKTIGGATTQYAYDGFGNLLTVALPSGASVEYLIDGLNRRVGKKVNGTRVEGFLYDGRLRPVAWLDGAGNVYARFVYGTRINVPEYMTTASGTFRVVTDHLGSPRLVINTSTGAVVQRVDYDEWGNVTYDSSPGFQPFGFAGGLCDRDTGLVRFGARDYDPSVGRWTNKDPVRFRGGTTNLYEYAASDPVNLIDPSGLCFKKAFRDRFLWNFKVTSRALVSPVELAWRYINGERPSAGEVILGLGADAALGAGVDAALAAVGVKSALDIIGTAIVDNAGLPIDWLAVGTDAAVSSGVYALAGSSAAAAGVAAGSALDALVGATLDSLTGNSGPCPEDCGGGG